MFKDIEKLSKIEKQLMVKQIGIGKNKWKIKEGRGNIKQYIVLSLITLISGIVFYYGIYLYGGDLEESYTNSNNENVNNKS